MGMKTVQHFSDGSPVHVLYVIDTQLLQVLTGSEEMNRQILEKIKIDFFGWLSQGATQ